MNILKLYSLYHSLIFKAIEKSNGNFGLGTNFKNIKDFFTRKNILSDSDIKAIQAYNAEINACTTSQTAFNRTMLNASKTAQDMVTSANGNVVALGNLTKASKATELGMKALAMAGNMLVSMGISLAIQGLITGIDKLSTASSDIAEKASEIGESFKSTQSEISDYKTRIQELHDTIHNSSSSIEDVTTARQNLMSIQSEMIEKYGNEKEAIDLVTDAVNNQSDAFDKLSKKKYKESINDFNKTNPLENIANSIDGYSSNKDRMISEMEVPVKINMITAANRNMDEYKKFEKSISKYGKIGAGKSVNGVDNYVIELSGGLESVYEKMLKIQEEASKYDFGSNDFSKGLTAKINETKKKLDKYSELYDNYVLYEKILSKSGNKKGYDQSFENVNNAMKAYKDAKIDGDDEKVKQAGEDYARILSGELEKISPDDENVKNYLQNLYPEMQEIVGKWNLQYELEAKPDNEKKLKKALDKFSGTNEIKKYDKNTSNNPEKNEAYNFLEDYANKYNLTIDQLIEKTQELGYIKPEQYNELVKQFGEDNIKKLSKDEIEIAYGFKNISDMTFEELQNKIAEIRKKEQDATKTFSQVWNSIGTTGSDEEKKAAKESKEEILELAKAGKLTQEKLKKSSIADEFDKAGISIYEATKKINKFAEASDQLATMGKGMSSITDALNEKQTNLSDKKTRTKGVKAETLAGFDAEIKGLESWDEFERTLGNGKKSMEQCRRAANKLATEWVGSNNFLANLNDTSKDYYISALDNMGVENAESIVAETLAIKRQEQAQADIDAEVQAGALAITKNGVTTETLNEVDALCLEKGASDELKYSMVDAIAQQNIFSNNSLSVDQKVEALRKLIEKYYEAGDAAEFLKRVQNGEDYQTAFNNSTNAKLVSGIEGPLATQPIIKVKKPSKNSDKKKGTKKQKQKKQKESKQEFDWMERKVTVLNNKLSETEKRYDAIAASMKKADSSSLVRKENANLNKQIRILRKLRSTYSKQEKKYQSKANKYAKENLSKDLQNKVKNGKIKGSYSKLVKEYGQTKADKIQKAIDLYEKASTARQNKVDMNTQIKDAKIQKHQNRADLAQTRIDKNAAKAELKHLSKKNKYIDNQIKYTKNLYSHQIEIARLNRDNEEVARLQAERDKEIRDLEIEKLQNLADEGEDSYNLYKTQASMTTNYKDRNKLAKGVTDSLRKQYNNLIKIADKEGDITEKNRLQLELQKQINEESKERIQNVSEDYENRLIGNARQMQVWNNAASLAESKGKTVNADFYNQMASVAGQEVGKRKKEVDDAWQTYYEQMKDNLNFINSPQWYEAIQTINDASNAYEQAQISAEQYRQKAIEANWGIVDSAKQAIDYLNDEAEVYKNIFGYKDMYDKNGVLTDAGTATFALDVYGIENNIAKIGKHNEEIDKVNKQYKDGDISIEKYNDRMQELKDGVMSAAEAIYSLRDAMKSLIEEGLNAEMDALNEAIDKVKQNLSDASSLREYQKNIEKQTKNIASLERQINAKSGDMSEKGRADVQKLKVQLEEAKSELEDTEYDKYIEDQERILDDMSDDFQKYLDAQLDQVDRLLKEIIDSVKNGNVDISEIIKQVGDTIGVDLSRVLSESLLMFATTGNTNAGGVYDNTVKDYKDSANEEFDKGEDTKIMNTDEKKGTVETNGQASNTTSNNTSTWQQGTVSEDLRKELLASTNTHFNSSSTDTLKSVSAEKERKSSNSKNMENIMKVLARVRKKEKDKEDSKATLSNYGSQKFANKYGKGNNKYLSMENVKKADNYVKKLVDVKTGKPMYDTSTGAKTYKALLTLNGKYGGVFGDAVKNRKATLPVGGFSKGGIVDTSTLKKIAKDNGDDAWVTVKSGEGILNPMDTKNIQALTESLNNFKHAGIQPLDSRNMVTNNVNANRNMYGDVNAHLDGSNVIDSKSFVKTVQSSREARNVILDVFASATTNDTMAYMRR